MLFLFFIFLDDKLFSPIGFDYHYPSPQLVSYTGVYDTIGCKSHVPDNSGIWKVFICVYLFNFIFFFTLVDVGQLNVRIGAAFYRYV